MRKLAYIAVLLMVGGLFMASCKSHERCPAYGDNTPHQDQNQEQPS